MNSPSLDKDREDAKKRLLRLIASIVALAAAAAGVFVVASHMTPKNQEAERAKAW